MKRLLLVLLAAFGLAAPAAAQEAVLRARADQIVALLRGESAADALFTPAFLAEVPPARLQSLAQNFAGQYGAAQRLSGLEVQAPQSAIAHVD